MGDLTTSIPKESGHGASMQTCLAMATIRSGKRMRMLSGVINRVQTSSPWRIRLTRGQIRGGDIEARKLERERRVAWRAKGAFTTAPSRSMTMTLAVTRTTRYTAGHHRLRSTCQ